MTDNTQQDNTTNVENVGLDNDVSAEKVDGLALFKDGFNFNFKVGDHLIHAWGSAKSGKELVHVDGQVVSDKRSFSRRSVHTFNLDNDSYEIEFQTVSLLTGELHCSLIKDGVHVETLKQVPKYTANKKEAKWRIGLWFVIGFFFGMFAVDQIISWFS